MVDGVIGVVWENVQDHVEMVMQIRQELVQIQLLNILVCAMVKMYKLNIVDFLRVQVSKLLNICIFRYL